MGMKKNTFRFPPEILEKLDEMVEWHPELNKSQIVRNSIRLYYDKKKEEIDNDDQLTLA